jgi:hypothetical protein
LINPRTGEIVFWTADGGIDGNTPLTLMTWTWSASIRCRGVSLRPQRSVCDRACPGASGDDDASVVARPVCHSLLI